MNNVNITGRMTKDVELTFANSGIAIGRFSVAVPRDMKDKKTDKYESDFINCKVFSKTAEFIANYSGKGKLVEISGRWETGSYEKDGRKIYTNDLVVEKFKPLEWGEKTDKPTSNDGWSEVTEDTKMPWDD